MASAPNVNTDRINRLTVYINGLKNRLTNIPAKHAERKEIYLDMINREIAKAEATIARLK